MTSTTVMLEGLRELRKDVLALPDNFGIPFRRSGLVALDAAIVLAEKLVQAEEHERQENGQQPGEEGAL